LKLKNDVGKSSRDQNSTVYICKSWLFQISEKIMIGCLFLQNILTSTPLQLKNFKNCCLLWNVLDCFFIYLKSEWCNAAVIQAIQKQNNSWRQAGVRNLFALRTGFSLELFCGPALNKILNVRQIYYNSQVIVPLVQWKIWTCFAAVKCSNL